MLPTSLFKESTLANTRKRKAPKNHENSEQSSIEKLPFEEVNIPPSKLMVSSLDPSPTSHWAILHGFSEWFTPSSIRARAHTFGSLHPGDIALTTAFYEQFH
jgi:hypothetical protein